jgi:sulfur carrier protein ThiS
MSRFVTLRYWSGGGLKNDRVELAGQETIAQLLDRLLKEPEFCDLEPLFREKAFVGVIVVNGQILDHSRLDELVLQGGEQLKVLRPVSGGG